MKKNFILNGKNVDVKKAHQKDSEGGGGGGGRGGRGGGGGGRGGMYLEIFLISGLGVMVFNATFNNISVISWGVSFIVGGNRRKPWTCHKSLTNFIT